MKNILKKNQLMITALAIMIAIAGYLQYAEGTMDDKAGDGVKAVDSGKVITENYVSGKTNQTGQMSDSLDGILELSEEDLLTIRGENAMDLLSLDSEVDVVMEDYLEDGMDLTVARTDGAGSELDANEAVSATPAEGEIPGEAVFTSAGAAILSDARLLKEQTRAKNKATLLEIIGNEWLSEEQKQQAVNSMVEMTQIAEKEAAAEILLEAKGFTDVVVSITGKTVDVVVNALSLTDVQRAQIEDVIMRKTGASPEDIIISTVVKD